MNKKPLNKPAYGRTPHLPSSRLGPGEHTVPNGMVNISTIGVPKSRDKKYRIITTEKLDGSCTSIAKIDNKLVPLTRVGYLAETSPFIQHHYFKDWSNKYYDILNKNLNNGDRVVGEWLCQAHSIRYNLTHEPWVPFAIFRNKVRSNFDDLISYIGDINSELNVVHPFIIEQSNPISIQDALNILGKYGKHGAIDETEGVVWVVEVNDKFSFTVKYVKENKQDGIYLPEISGKDPIWNWLP